MSRVDIDIASPICYPVLAWRYAIAKPKTVPKVDQLQGIPRRWLPPALLRRQPGQRSCRSLRPPRREVRRVQPLATKQRTELAVPGRRAIGLIEDAFLVPGRECPPRRPVGLRIRHRHRRRGNHPRGRLGPGGPSAAVGFAPLALPPLRAHRARPSLDLSCCHLSVLPSHLVPAYLPSTRFPRGQASHPRWHGGGLGSLTCRRRCPRTGGDGLRPRRVRRRRPRPRGAGRHPRGRADRAAASAHELLAPRRPPRYPAFVAPARGGRLNCYHRAGD